MHFKNFMLRKIRKGTPEHAVGAAAPFKRTQAFRKGCGCAPIEACYRFLEFVLGNGVVCFLFREEGKAKGVGVRHVDAMFVPGVIHGIVNRWYNQKNNVCNFVNVPKVTKELTKVEVKSCTVVGLITSEHYIGKKTMCNRPLQKQDVLP